MTEKPVGRTREAEAKYRSLVETIPAVVYIDDFDDSSVTIYMSPQVETLLGYTPDEFFNATGLWMDIVHPEDRERIRAYDEHTDRTGDPWSVEYRMIARDGRIVWVQDEAVIVRDEDGTPLCWQGVWTDVTGRKRAEEQLKGAESRYRGLVEQLPGVIYLDPVDESQGTIYVSPQVEEMLGFAPEEWAQNPELWYERLHPDDRLRAVQEWHQSRDAGGPFISEYRFLAKDGRVVWVSEHAIILRDDDGNPAVIQGVMLDVTDRKRAEEELEHAWQREREAAADLRALDRMKNTLLHAVSHDLRGPISAVLGASIVLARSEQDLAPEEREQMIRGVGSSARKMNRIVTDLLDFDRIDRGILEPKCEPTDLCALINRVVAELDVPEDTPVEIEAGFPDAERARPLVLSVDPARAERIVENLVLNAAKHTPPGTPVWVRVLPEGGGVVIAVEDSGPGVPEELRGSIFQPFRQGEGGSARGSGIGLSLVARFAELHGGQAWVEPRAGGGASFRVFLPDAEMRKRTRDGITDTSLNE